jgi:hypothetical protein
MSHHLQEVMREPLRDELPSDLSFTEAFDRFEYLLALVHGDIYGRKHHGISGPLGEFALVRRTNRGRNPMQGLTDEIMQLKQKHPLLAVGLFNGSLDRLNEVKQIIDSRASGAGLG